MNAESQARMATRNREKPDLKAIGSRVRHLRGEMLQEELANYLCISQGQLSKIEHGKIAPTVDVLFTLSEKFGKNIEWILRGK